MNVQAATKKKRVNMRKWRNLTLLGALSVFMVATHQNCAPASQMNGSATHGLYSVDPEVGVIDNVNRNTAVSFAMKELQLNPQLSEVALEGQCSLEQEDAVLAWEVRKQTGADELEDVFATGQAICRGGRFSIGLAPTQLLDCGKPYTVKARLGRGTEGASVITRACPN